MDLFTFILRLIGKELGKMKILQGFMLIPEKSGNMESGAAVSSYYRKLASVVF